MDAFQQPLTHLAKLLFCATVAALALIFLAPVLALVGMLLALAGMLFSALFPLLMVGLLLWLFHYLLGECRPVARPLVQKCTHGALLGCRSAAMGSYQAARWVLGQYGALVRHFRCWSSSLLTTVQNFGWRVGGITLETLCGGVLLGGLAGLTLDNLPARLQGEYLFFAVLGGLALGLTVGLANYLPTRACPDE